MKNNKKTTPKHTYI